LLAMLQGTDLAHVGGAVAGVEGGSGNVLMDSLNAASGPALQNLRSELALTFEHLMMISAAVSLFGLAAALSMPNHLLRGREHQER